MAKPVNIPNSFATSTSAIPLSYLDQDFNALANSTNDLATYSNYVADTGAANAYIANFPTNTNTSSLTAGLRVQFKAANANTGTSTLNVQVNSVSIGSGTIKLTDGSNLPANAIIAGALVDVMYDGTNFQLLSDSSGGAEVITNLTVTGNATVAGTTTLTGNLAVDTNVLFVDTASNNVGIGTTSPLNTLSIYNATNSSALIAGDSTTALYTIRSSNDTSPSFVSIRKSRGTTASPTAVNSADGSGELGFSAYGGSNYRNVARLRGFVDTYTSDTNISGYLTFETNGGSTTVTERMRIDSTGNVGIGTASPAARLETNVASGNNEFRMTIAGTTSAQFIASTTDFTFVNNRTGAQVFFNNGSERMRIDSSGNVGIGTSSPSTYGKFVVNGSSNADTAIFIGNASLTGSAPTYKGTVRIIDNPVSSTGHSGGLEFLTSTFGSGYGWKIAAIDSSGVPLTFSTRQNSATWTESMRIGVDGNVGIGTTSPGDKLTVIGAGQFNVNANGTSTPLKLSNDNTTGTVVAKLAFQNQGNIKASINAAVYNNDFLTFNTGSDTERMRIDSSGNLTITGATATKASGTTWANPSDIRLKDNVQDFNKGLTELLQVNVKTWEYNGKGGTVEGTKGLGVIADEIEIVLPETVDTYKAKLNIDDIEDTDIKRFDATEITWLLVNSIQEQQTIINDLKARIETLETK